MYEVINPGWHVQYNGEQQSHLLPLVLTTITKMFGVRKGLVERIKLTKSIVSPQHDWQLTFTYNLFCTINQASAVDCFHRIITINVLKVLPVSTRVRLLSVTNKTSSVFVRSIYIKRLEKRNVVSIPDPYFIYFRCSFI